MLTRLKNCTYMLYIHVSRSVLLYFAICKSLISLISSGNGITRRVFVYSYPSFVSEIDSFSLNFADIVYHL